MLSNHSSFIVTFSTSPSSSALQIRDGTSQPSFHTGQPSQPSNCAEERERENKNNIETEDMSAFDTYSVDSDHHQNHADEDNFSGYGGYSNFSGGNVPIVDHTSPSASPDIFGFSDLDRSYSQSPFELVHVAENGNDNDYHDDSVFVSDEPVLPAPTEM
ncbi:hypothetical protein HN51_064746 [Arachis hypogaea]